MLRLYRRLIKVPIYYILCLLGIVLMFLIWSNTQHEVGETIEDIKKIIESIKLNQTDMKYILIWTDPKTDPIFYLRKGQEAFVERNCPQINCFVITDSLVLDITKYDVILFHGPEIMVNKHIKLPEKRSPHQKYVFASIESSGYYPVEDDRYNDFFNLTWSYRLNSDKYSGYIAIRNKKGEIIGPREVMHWEDINEMKPINDNIRRKLSHKNKIAAWFVSNCRTPGKREEFARKVQKELENFGLSIDVYGWCGNLKCPRDKIEDCLKLIERDYYFYFSFENSFSQDYVTEKLLYPLQHYAVPVVYGGANYTRFMPDGIYLDARQLGPRALATEMVYLINVKEKYYDYFKWHNYYSYHDVDEVPETDPYCKLCSLIHEQNQYPVSIHDFRKWWDPPKYP